ncbi:MULTISPECIES: hypothetical protein [unclassified Streptomyces]|uniref:hypothetical protein n=1 Tax=unclassified Streptomyces TaxID=2593676 RepID=UPI00093B228F|nr:hypothetical protein [Streptomyces sp. CB02058]OKI97896.1 hypothetical protein AMK10_03500 [Streptomyces sp. CB02058]
MYATQALTQLVPFAADELDKNKVTPGVLGFLVFAALAVGVWLLMKSMNRHMGKVNFEEAPDPAAQAEPAADGGDAQAGTPSAAGASSPSGKG